MGKVHMLRISRACDVKKYSVRHFPSLRIKGHWLQELSWNVGMRVQVDADENRIVIRKIVEEVSDPDGTVELYCPTEQLNEREVNAYGTKDGR